MPMCCLDLPSRRPAEVSLPDSERFGVKPVQVEKFVLMADAGTTMGSEMQLLLLGRWVAKIYKLTSSMQAIIPKYEPYVVASWDQEKVVENILKHSWESVATSWQLLSRELSRAKLSSLVADVAAKLWTRVCESTLRRARLHFARFRATEVQRLHAVHVGCAWRPCTQPSLTAPKGP